MENNSANDVAKYVRRWVALLGAGAMMAAGLVGMTIASAPAAAADTCWSYRTVETDTSDADDLQAKFQVKSCASGRKHARIQFCNLKASGKSSPATIGIHRKIPGEVKSVKLLEVSTNLPRAKSCKSTGGVRVWQYHSYFGYVTADAVEDGSSTALTSDWYFS